MANPASSRSDVVSFEDENLILVDEDDNEIGNLPKDKCHDGDGRLHRAFSVFIFDPDGNLLLQQRSAQKRLWPLYWSNACCSHPRRGETMAQAVDRRLSQELGLAGELEFLFKFIYQAQYNDAGAEHELCWVYLGRTRDQVAGNANEIANWRFVPAEEFDHELDANPDMFTPWVKLEWRRIREQFGGRLKAFTSPFAAG